jgi:hypothetical protein
MSLKSLLKCLERVKAVSEKYGSLLGGSSPHSESLLKSFFLPWYLLGYNQRPGLLRNESVHPNYRRKKNTASALRPNGGIDTVHLPAPACMFSNGLPLPLTGLFVSSEPGADVEEAPCVDASPKARAIELGDAAVDDGVSVEHVSRPRVDVIVDPVLMPVGPNTIGTMICSILPSLSVIVFV